MTGSSSAKVCVIVVNWNGWRDTVQCLESLLRSEQQPPQIIVCDNGSEDGSVAKLIEWAAGTMPPPAPATESLQSLVLPPVPKPVNLAVGDPIGDRKGAGHSRAAVIVLEIGQNMGFAAANNIGMRYAEQHFACEYFWLLNNDTLVTPGALQNMLSRVRTAPDAGICGSTLARMDAPNSIQAQGGASYNRWLGVPRHVGEGEPVGTVIDSVSVESHFDYVVGASMLVSKQFVQAVGFLSEDYFLYFEELDWALRARDNYRLLYAPASLVYHKEGASTGGKLPYKKRPVTTDYYWIRNRLLVTVRHYPYALPTVAFACLVTLVRRAVRAGPLHALRILRLLLTHGWELGRLAKGGSRRPRTP